MIKILLSIVSFIYHQIVFVTMRPKYLIFVVLRNLHRAQIAQMALIGIISVFGELCALPTTAINILVFNTQKRPILQDSGIVGAVIDLLVNGWFLAHSGGLLFTVALYYFVISCGIVLLELIGFVMFVAIANGSFIEEYERGLGKPSEFFKQLLDNYISIWLNKHYAVDYINDR